MGHPFMSSKGKMNRGFLGRLLNLRRANGRIYPIGMKFLGESDKNVLRE